jgi:Tol biopolymer transport system component
MRGLWSRLLGGSALDPTRGRPPRGHSSIYVLALEDWRAVPGTLRKLSPTGDFSQGMVSRCGSRVAWWGTDGRDSVPKIWVARTDGQAGAACLTRGDGMQGHPYWHPDGVQLVHFASEAKAWDPRRQFSTDRAPTHLRWLDTRTGASHALTEGPYVDERPAVAPDGLSVVFVSNRSGRLNLWRVQADGSALTQLTAGPGPDYRPCISPDGRRLAYFSTSPDGSHQVRVRSLPGGEEVDCGWTERFQWSHGPFWCPDGRSMLVHARERGAPSPSLWIAHLESGATERIDTPGVAGASHATVDAAGRWLAFDSRRSPDA